MLLAYQDGGLLLLTHTDMDDAVACIQLEGSNRALAACDESQPLLHERSAKGRLKDAGLAGCQYCKARNGSMLDTVLFAQQQKN